MKLKKLGLSVLTITTLVANAYSADSLSEALTNGKFDGGFKAVMYDVDKAAGGRESITSLCIIKSTI